MLRKNLFATSKMTKYDNVRQEFLDILDALKTPVQPS